MNVWRRASGNKGQQADGASAVVAHPSIHVFFRRAAHATVASCSGTSDSRHLGSMHYFHGNMPLPYTMKQRPRADP